MAKGFGGALKSFKNLKKVWKNSKVGGKLTKLPNGTYQGKLVEAVLSATKKSNHPNVKLVIEVLGGDYEKQKVVVNHIFPLDNEESLEMRVSQLKNTLSLWFPEEDQLNEIGNLFFDELEKSQTGNDVVWTSPSFEKILEKLQGSELEFKVVNKKSKTDGNEYMNIYLNDLISAPDTDLGGDDDSKGKDANTSDYDVGEEEDDLEEVEDDEDDVEDEDDDD